jgi:nucleotide-binding universal stress UspA family protein
MAIRAGARCCSAPRRSACCASATRLGDGGHSLVPILRDAPPSRALTELADEIAADLVVVGSSGRGQVAREFLGSVSHNVATTLPCDVLVVS